MELEFYADMTSEICSAFKSVTQEKKHRIKVEPIDFINVSFSSSFPVFFTAMMVQLWLVVASAPVVPLSFFKKSSEQFFSIIRTWKRLDLHIVRTDSAPRPFSVLHET